MGAAMSKLRLTLLIITFFSIISLNILIFLEPTNWLAYIIFLILIIYCNIRLKKIERERLFKITMIYLNDCNPERYLVEIENYQKKLVKTRLRRLIDKISNALILMDIGKLQDSHDILNSIIPYEAKLSPFVKFWYYKAWIYYLEEIKCIDKIEVLMAELYEIANTAPRRYKMQLQDNYQLVLSRYYVLAGIYLDKAEESFAEVFTGTYPKLVVIISHYYLGLIALKQGRYNLALERFDYVVNNGPKLYISSKSINLIKQINNQLNNQY